MQIPTPITKKMIQEIDFMELGNEDWRLRRVRLGSMFSYFTYAQTQVSSLIPLFEKLSDDFEEIAYAYVSCTIAAYGHMAACSNFIKIIAKSLGVKIPTHDQRFQEELNTKRNRIQAHPEGTKNDKTIITHDAVIMRTGIHFPIWKQKRVKGEMKEEYILQPEVDLMNLSKLLELISKAAIERYRDDKKNRH